MRELEERICRDGIVEDAEVLKVDSFLNHQMDVELFAAMGREWARLFAGAGVNKILTIEASGIGIACVAAQQFGVPVVFAKKSRTKNIAGEVYHTDVPSFTHGGSSTVIVSKRFLGPADRLLPAIHSFRHWITPFSRACLAGARQGRLVGRGCLPWPWAIL